MATARIPDASPAAIRIASLGAESLAQVEAISARAFDPRFGEAWNKAQCLSVLSLPGYRLRGAWIEEPGTAPILAGFAIFRSVADESELLLIAVDPVYRHRTVASHLLEDWLSNSREKDIARAFLEMREDNPARPLYERYGFKQLAIRKAYYRGNDGVMRDAVTMDCRLR
jgi:[ribosomal protein S18]-alanine N-acetyltransferase